MVSMTWTACVSRVCRRRRATSLARHGQGRSSLVCVKATPAIQEVADECAFACATQTLCRLLPGHRAQFEALLRSVWALYGASPEHLNKLSAVLNDESEQGAKNLPQVAEMMAAVEKNGPPQAFDALSRFKSNSWKALNSYAHAGIHPLRRHAEGYPIQLFEGIAKNANGLGVVAAMQSAVLSGVQPLQREILSIASQYSNCMPPPI